VLLRAIGSALIIIAFTAFGLIHERKMGNRAAQLSDINAILDTLENEINLLHMPVEEAFKRAVRNINSPVTALFTLDTGETLSIRERFHSSLKKNTAATNLIEGDIRVLEDFGRLLGCSDAESQVFNIRAAVKRLDERRRQAELRRSGDGVMYKKLWILCGLAIVILFL
jgi:stage III sporulation protein AB